MMVKEPGSGTELKDHSCLICRRRKVKCDRRKPCSNCVKGAQQCAFVPPTRGKRKRTKPPREGLHAKVRRYEELLKSYGVKIETCDSDSDSESEAVSQSRLSTHVERRTPNEPPCYPLQQKPSLIHKEGSSRYIDSLLWPNLESQVFLASPKYSKVSADYQQYLYLDDSDNYRPQDEADDDGSDIFLGLSGRDGRGTDPHAKFENLQPPDNILLKLWDIFVDRVDPFAKILHLPTFWSSLKSAIQRPKDVPSDLQALIFSFYLATITSLEEGECLELLGGHKPHIFARHERVARRALRDAGFLNTTSVTTLRAYCVFLMAMGPAYRADSLFILTGAAVRHARKMGLHRDGTYLGLSPFETEMRRRLWWHIMGADFRTSVLLSTQPSMDLFANDVKRPLNVEDEDLSPNQAELPPERNGLTTNVVCLLRCEIFHFLRKFSEPLTAEVHWETLANPAVSQTKKTEMIKELEDSIETKYLRYCDPTNTLHALILVMGRSSLCKIKLYAHHPRIYANRGLKVPEEERAVIFTNAKKLLEYMDLVRSTKSLDKYMWQTGTMMLWNALFYVLIEARQRKTGPEVDQLWKLMGVVVSKYAEVFKPNTGVVYDALRKWLLEAWEEHCAAVKAKGRPEPPAPDYIDVFRRCQAASEESPAAQRVQTDLNNVDAKPGCDNGGTARRHDGDSLVDCESVPSYDFSNPLSFDADADEWAQWESLVIGEGFPWQF